MRVQTTKITPSFNPEMDQEFKNALRPTGEADQAKTNSTKPK